MRPGGTTVVKLAGDQARLTSSPADGPCQWLVGCARRRPDEGALHSLAVSWQGMRGKVINFSEILGNVPKFWDSSLKFWDSVPKFIWEIFRPPTDLRALIFLRSKEHDKRTFTEPVYYRYNCVSRGHCATIPRFQVITRRPTGWMRAAR